jgi:hypothetical protein
MKTKNGTFSAFALLALTALTAFTTLAGAHLTGESLVPKGGETVKVGDVVKVTWSVATAHDGKMDIDFSANGGTTWTSIQKAFMGANGANTFTWTVPNQVTKTMKLRICQTNGTVCTDANNVSAPTSGAPYVLVSGAFTVEAATALISNKSEENPMFVGFGADSRNVEVSFSLGESQPVRLEAFDTQGRLVSTLLEGQYGAGVHKMSVFSNRLVGTPSSLVFKLKVGEKVLTQNGIGIR